MRHLAGWLWLNCALKKLQNPLTLSCKKSSVHITQLYRQSTKIQLMAHPHWWPCWECLMQYGSSYSKKPGSNNWLHIFDYTSNLTEGFIVLVTCGLRLKSNLQATTGQAYDCRVPRALSCLCLVSHLSHILIFLQYSVGCTTSNNCWIICLWISFGLQVDVDYRINT